MSKTLKLMSIFFIIISIFGCKYEDGPMISLKSASARAIGTYRVSKCDIAGNNSTTIFNEFICNSTITFNKSDKIILDESVGCGIQASWGLEDKNSKLRISISSLQHDSLGPWKSGVVSKWDIHQLKDDEMTISTTYNNIHYKLWLTE